MGASATGGERKFGGTLSFCRSAPLPDVGAPPGSGHSPTSAKTSTPGPLQQSRTWRARRLAPGFDAARPTLVIEGKSDVAPAAETILRYRHQVADYLRATGVPEDFIVFPTDGRVERMAA